MSGDDDAPEVGRTTGDDEPATAEGIDLDAGDAADAVTDGGPKPPDGDEPDLKDVGAVPRRSTADETLSKMQPRAAGR